DTGRLGGVDRSDGLGSARERGQRDRALAADSDAIGGPDRAAVPVVPVLNALDDRHAGCARRVNVRTECDCCGHAALRRAAEARATLTATFPDSFGAWPSRPLGQRRWLELVGRLRRADLDRNAAAGERSAPFAVGALDLVPGGPALHEPRRTVPV